MRFSVILFAFVCVFFGCSSDDNGTTGGGTGGGLVAQATYRITFTPNFTSMTHPTDYPANASFTQMFVMFHSAESSIYTIGQSATVALESYAEDGEVSGLVTALTANNEGDPITIIRTGNDIGPTGQDSVEFTITPETTLISFVAKISPSPDWIVGIDSFDIANDDDTLVEDTEIALFPIDAGTDAGTTYDSADAEESGVVTSIDGAPFSAGNVGLVNSLGTIRIERIDN